MTTSVRDDFVARVEKYCAEQGISEDKFGRMACNGDQHAIPHLRRGRATLKRLEAINAFMLTKFVPTRKKRTPRATAA